MRAVGDTAAAGWPLSAALAMAFVTQTVRVGRRRSALNRALHELRRPLQALALAGPEPALASSIDLAFVALAQLDAEVNGLAPATDLRPGRCRPLLESCAARWRSRAALAGGSIEVRWQGSEEAHVVAPAAVAQAVDNLIVNAFEHGGPSIVLDGKVQDRSVRIRVADNGRESRAGWRIETPSEAVSRLTGRRRRGHGLEVVRRLATAQGGRFVLERSEHRSVAALELPLANGGERLRAA